MNNSSLAVLDDINKLRDAVWQMVQENRNYRYALAQIANMPADGDFLQALNLLCKARQVSRQALNGGPGQTPTGTVGEASQPTVERQGVTDPASAQVHHSS